MGSVLLIGIAGGTASGKTTLTNALLERLNDQAVVVYHDSYYKAHPELSYDERRQLNYDEPDAFDNDLMIHQLAELREGRAVDSPTYDYTRYDRAEATVRIEPHPVIIVEGILLFSIKELRDLFDIKLFVDTDADVRVLRRIRRDVQERGRSLTSVTEQYLNTVKPMHELYVEPSKSFADVIIPEGGKNLVALDMILRRIEHELSNGQD